MHPIEIKIRRNICRKCTIACELYQSGEIDHADPCEACPELVWGVLGSDCGPIAEDAPLVIANSDKQRISSPGELLKVLIYRITGRVPSNCACNSRARKMDQWGWKGCWTHRAIILDWLSKEAEALGHSIGKYKLLSLFIAGFAEMKNQVQDSKRV